MLSVRFQINQSNELTQIVLACDVPQNLRRQHISQQLFHRFLQYYNLASAKRSLRAALHEPGLKTDAGQVSVEFYVYTSPGWVDFHFPEPQKE